MSVVRFLGSAWGRHALPRGSSHGLTALCLALGVALVGTTPTQAAPLTFFGEDLGQGEGVRLASHPNSDTARNAFLANLVGVGTETFESFAAGTSSPINLTFPGAGSATLTSPGAFVANVPTGTNGVGRYPISGNQYWETGSNMTVTFTAPVAAFGFYGVDIGDFGGQVILTTVGGTTTTINIGNTVNGKGGAVLYFGVIDVANPFTSIQFGNTAAGTDFFGFDDMTIGSVQQVSIVPVPPALAMAGIGSLTLLGYRWRRRKAIA